ncbi:uncharacterized protein LOC128397176 [Panonychus citri]|uniref:uncharacterized protein LOC128397176 n=1 Tax=Panonychus citri TaxID=50023 RepID=UPI002307ED1F|nr:uncharacterized protein LOC128397176 [Panonychus citri]
MSDNEEILDEHQLNRLSMDISSNLMSSSLYTVPTFRGDDNSNAKAWMKKFETISEHFEWSDDQKRLRFKSHLAGPAANWYYLRVEQAEITEFSSIKERFIGDFTGEDQLEKMKRRKLNKFEKIQSYVYDKVGLCKEVNKNMTEDEILNYIYEGMPVKLRNAICIAGPKDYYELINIGKRLENVPVYTQEEEKVEEKKVSENPTMKMLEQLMMEVNNLKLSSTNYPRRPQGYGQNNNYQGNRNYGNRPRFPRNHDGEVMCYTCGRKGHVTRFCPLNGQTHLPRNHHNSGNYNNNYQNRRYNREGNNNQVDRRIPFIPQNNQNQNQQMNTSNQPVSFIKEENRIIVSLEIHNKKFDAIIDTGAENSFITTNCYSALNCELKPWTGGSIKGINGSLKIPIGEVKVPAIMKQDERKTKVNFEARVLEYLPYDIIIGMSTMKEAKALIDPVENKIFFREEIEKEKQTVMPINEIEKHETNNANGFIVNQTGIIVPPKSSVIIKVQAQPMKNFNEKVIITPAPKFNNSARLKFSLNEIEFKKGLSEATICNTEDFSFYIKSNETIGQIKKICKSRESVFTALESNHELDEINAAQDEMENEVEQNEINDAVKTELQNLCLSKGTVSIGASLNHDRRNQLAETLEKYIDRFAFAQNQLGKTSCCQHQIDTGKNRPFSLAPYGCSLSERLAIKTEINRMKSLGVIVESTSPYSSPVIIVGKKDGGVRICGDFRRLNKDTVPDVYPLPSVQDALDCVSGCKYFSLIDLKSGYWQIEIDPRDREKTAIITRDGLFEFIVMPFGLRNAPATFQRLMDSVLADLKWIICIPYLDDILIFSKTFKEHLSHIDKVMDRLRLANLLIQPPKVAFAVNAINYLGHTLTAEGISPQQDKIKAVLEVERPSNVDKLRQFLGLASYHRRFIKDFSIIAKPLSSLTKKDTPYEWKEEQQKAFDDLKQALISHPILAHFDIKLPVEVRCDGSSIGLGAILIQLHPDGDKVVAYASRMTSKPEKNYAISELEALAIVYALEKFRSYLIGIKFKVVTDHCSLCWMFSKRKLTPRLTRWALSLQEFDFEVVYKSGKHHKDTDCLSRNPVDEPNEPRIERDLNLLAITERINDLESEQRRNKRLNQIIEMLEGKIIITQKERRKVGKFTMVNNILNRCVFTRTGPKLVPVIPSSLRREIMYSMHDDPLSGHLGQQKTLERVRSRFYFPQMRKYVNNYVKTCDECQTRKRSYLTPAGLLQPITVGGVAERFGIDILGPFPKSFKENKYIVVSTEYFTRFAIVKALPEATTAQIAIFIVENIVCQFGSPKEILSDRGSQFRSKLMAELTGLMQTKHKFTTAYHPQCNGLTERFNATLANMMSMYVDNAHKTWDRALHFVAFAYNSAINSSTGFSPFYLMYGRDPVFPLERFIQSSTQGLSGHNHHSYAESLTEHLHNIRKIAQDNLKNSQYRGKVFYDQNRLDKRLTVGTKVLVFTPQRKVGKSDKLMHNWLGPYKIIEVMSPLVYKVEHTLKENKIEIVNISRLKIYHERKVSDDETTDDEETEILDNNERYNLDLPTQIINPTTGETVSNSKSKSNSNLDQEIDDNDNNSLVVNKSDDETIVYNPDYEVDTEVSQHDNEEEDEMLNNNQPLERYQRARRPPAKLANYFLFGLFLFCFSGFSHESFIKNNPIIWKERKVFIVKGIQPVIVKVKYESPCHLLDDKELQSISYLKPIMKWCKQSFENDFIEPVKSLCQEPKVNKREIKERSKRAIISGLLTLGTIVISSFLSVGIGAITMTKEMKLETKFDELHLVQDQLLKETEKIAQNQITTKKALQAMQISIKNVTKQISDFHNRINQFEAAFPQTLYVVSHLTSKFMQTKNILLNTERKMKNDEFEPRLMEILNITLPCKNNCPVELIEPNECYLDQDNQEIHFNFDAKIISPSSHLLVADPFQLITVNNNSHFCQVTYQGPQEVLYNTDKDCITQIRNMVETNINQIHIQYNRQICIFNSFNLSMDNLWSPENCHHKPTSQEAEIVQIKFTKNNNFIYCPSKEIELFNKTHACPNFVFDVPANITFKINNILYHPTAMKITNNLKFIEDWNFRINMHFNPHSLDPLIINLNKTDQLIDQIDTPLFNKIRTGTTTYVFIILTIIFGILILNLTFTIVYLVMKNKKKKTNVAEPQVENSTEKKVRRPLLRRQKI